MKIKKAHKVTVIAPGELEDYTFDLQIWATDPAHASDMALQMLEVNKDKTFEVAHAYPINE